MYEAQVQRQLVPAGSDAIALLHLCDALLINLSQTCQNKSLSPKPERKLPNIFDNMEAWLPMDISRRVKPAIPAAYMQPLSPDRMQEIVEPYMASVWSELDANWTQALISRFANHFPLPPINLQSCADLLIRLYRTYNQASH